MIKRLFSKLLALLMISMVFMACSSNSDVIQNQIIHKRKYRKGFFKEKRNKYKVQKISTEEMLPLKPIAKQDVEIDNSLEPVKLGQSTTPPCILPWSDEDQKLTFDMSLEEEFSFEQSSLELDVFSRESEEMLIEIEAAEVVPDQLTQLGENGFDKSQVGAALFCFFLGFLGIHRFYLGYPLIGILQLITLGGCGLWALIDFIRIVLGDLQPAAGNYYDTIDF